jgi:hypothetical protein
MHDTTFGDSAGSRTSGRSNVGYMCTAKGLVRSCLYTRLPRAEQDEQTNLVVLLQTSNLIKRQVHLADFRLDLGEAAGLR